MIASKPHSQSPCLVRSRSRLLLAFTLVEVLLVVSLFAVLSLAIFQTFASGVKIWDRASTFFPEEDIMISFEKMSHDLHNTFYFSQFKFQGSANAIEFPSMIMTKADAHAQHSDPYVQQIGLVRYRFDKSKKQLLRQQADYGQASSKKWQDETMLVGGVEQGRFIYLYRDKNRLVERLTGKDVLPEMVKVEIDYTVKSENRHLTRFIDLPASLSDL